MGLGEAGCPSVNNRLASLGAGSVSHLFAILRGENVVVKSLCSCRGTLWTIACTASDFIKGTPLPPPF